MSNENQYTDRSSTSNQVLKQRCYEQNIRHCTIIINHQEKKNTQTSDKKYIYHHRKKLPE